MPVHVHGEGGGPRPSRFTRNRRRLGGGADAAPIGDPARRRQRVIIVSGSLGFAVAAGVALFLSAVFAARQVPYSVRLYAAPSEGAPYLLRVAAYDAKERVGVKVQAVEIHAAGDRPSIVFQGMADGAAVVRIDGPDRAGRALMVKTAAGTRTVRIPPAGPARVRPVTIAPVSAEFRKGGGREIMGRVPENEGEADDDALAALRVLMYPEQGRLAANLPNTIFVWARDCPGRTVKLGTAAGAGVLQSDAFGVSSFVFNPTLGQTWFDVACGDFKGKVELRDRPQGIAATSKALFAKGEDTVAMAVSTLASSRPVTMDAYRDCAWIDSLALVPAGGEALVTYSLPGEPGLYTFEFYGNVHAPGEERSRVRVVVPSGAASAAVRDLLARVEGADKEPIAARLGEIVAWDGDVSADALAPIAAALFSRIDQRCGPPPMVLDTYDDDALYLAASKDGVKRAAYTGLGITWMVALVAAIVIMVLRIRAARDAEEQIEGHKKHIALQHALAAALITVVFALLIYTLDVWWKQ